MSQDKKVIQITGIENRARKTAVVCGFVINPTVSDQVIEIQYIENGQIAFYFDISVDAAMDMVTAINIGVREYLTRTGQLKSYPVKDEEERVVN